MALETVQEMVTTARVLLQDVDGDRVSDAELLVGLNAALLEMRRLRPDMFISTANSVPDYAAVDSTDVDVDQQYRMAVVYYMVGHAQLRDEEDTSDARASALLQKFTAQLTGVA